ncbi:3-hydroxyacyl-CoA dehydrogenase NAD-binding domain-containing protein [Thalassotalea psychrophila]|uniref:3-hydroxyacyl-CoA dehydrogenase NAD-binding domain-containing protein n=1 Tax=Thalassotalea psychrophila TaxID=3065647 RepID=A0ABY9TZI8_9GAMM|nr:3-hydroxyacyl-CoA dehydrogenase NAD-binding domain-containing protein [Colwelliaceae bacterium SQ149]
MSIKSIAIVGGGEMGCQIAIQCAYSGFKVIVFDIAKDAQTLVKQRFDRMIAVNTESDIWSSTDAEKAYANLTITTELTDIANVDLVNESVFESLEVKHDIWSKLAKVCSEHTIFTTNSSSLRPSDFAQSTGRPERFAALHFHLKASRIVDVMTHGGTSIETMDILEELVPQLGLIPIRLEKEHPQYVLNSMVIGIQQVVGNLLLGEFTNYEDIDRCWMDLFKTPYGPCGLMDNVGLDTVMKIMLAKTEDDKAQQFAQYLKTHYVNKGSLGVKSGQGFYNYPEPTYAAAEFIDAK